jgi:uridine phosphorylase
MPHHLGDVKTSARTAVVTGDPERVPHLGAACGMVRESWSRRGYVGAEVDADGDTLLVCSTGIGGPTAAIVVEELCELGIEQVVRVGTCGAMQPNLAAGELVVATASVRDEGTAVQYLPLEFPAAADHRLTAAILAAAAESGHVVHVGVVHSKDAYYAEDVRRMPFGDNWRERWAALRSAGVLATDMETAALFVVAAVRRIRAAAVLVPVDDSLSKQAELDALAGAMRAAVAGALAHERALLRASK